MEKNPTWWYSQATGTDCSPRASLKIYSSPLMLGKAASLIKKTSHSHAGIAQETSWALSPAYPSERVCSDLALFSVLILCVCLSLFSLSFTSISSCHSALYHYIGDSVGLLEYSGSTTGQYPWDHPLPNTLWFGNLYYVFIMYNFLP